MTASHHRTPTEHRDFRCTADWYRPLGSRAAAESWPMETHLEAADNASPGPKVQWVSGPHTGQQGRLVGMNPSRTHLQIRTATGVQWARVTDVRLMAAVEQDKEAA
jgi:hypothetical protein